jgi:4-methyl-5(b-hydroxyethyl)-thiazole monophosphate biosynthesis
MVAQSGIDGGRMGSVLVILAPGAEEIEAMTVPDVLVRAGQQVLVASTADTPVVRGSRGLPLAAHTLLDVVLERTFDLIYLPGGMGSATTCRDDARVQALAAAQLAAGRLLAVICAASIALVPRGLAAGRRLTSYPGVRAQVEPHAAAWLDQAVVTDGNLITSQGPGTALALGLHLAHILAGTDVATKVGKDMIAAVV